MRQYCEGLRPLAFCCLLAVVLERLKLSSIRVSAADETFAVPAYEWRHSFSFPEVERLQCQLTRSSFRAVTPWKSEMVMTAPSSPLFF